MRGTSLARLGDARGETLVETLAAIVVCALAVVVLMTATLAAARINRQAQERDADLQAQQEAAASGAGTTGGTVTFDGISYDVTYLFSGGDDVVSYSSVQGGSR